MKSFTVFNETNRRCNNSKIHSYLLKNFYYQIIRLEQSRSHHSHKKRNDSLEIRAEPAVLCVYDENHTILEPILLYRASKCKQTKKQGSKTVYGPTFLPSCETNISVFLLYKSRCGLVRIQLSYNRL